MNILSAMLVMWGCVSALGVTATILIVLADARQDPWANSMRLDLVLIAFERTEARA